MTAYPLTWHGKRTGFAFSVSLDNLWHVLWHAVPMREYAQRAVRDLTNDLTEGPTSALHNHTTALSTPLTTAHAVLTTTASSATLGSGGTNGWRQRHRPNSRSSLRPTRANDRSLRTADAHVETLAAVASAATAVPAAEVAASAEHPPFDHPFEHVDMLPHYTYRWPDPPKPKQQGLRKGSTALAAAMMESVAAYMRTPGRVSKWTGWELAGLALMPVDAWGRAVNHTQAVLAPGQWHCYSHLFGGQ
jgi:hypothetical protein